MRAKITIVFETHGSGSADKHNDWPTELLDRICNLLDIPEEPEPGREDEYPLVTFDVVAVEKLTEEPE